MSNKSFMTSAVDAVLTSQSILDFEYCAKKDWYQDFIKKKRNKVLANQWISYLIVEYLTEGRPKHSTGQDNLRHENPAVLVGYWVSCHFCQSKARVPN